MPHLTQKNPKIKKTHNKFGINPWNKKKQMHGGH